MATMMNMILIIIKSWSNLEWLLIEEDYSEKKMVREIVGVRLCYTESFLKIKASKDES